MKFKQIILATALIAGGTSAFAADQTIDISSGQASFAGIAALLDGGDDVISFVNLAAGTYDVHLSFKSQNITGLGADLNGEAAQVMSFRSFTFGGLDSRSNGPLVLTFSGLAGNAAAYSGDLSVTAVPEPSTVGMLLAGFGVVGFIARRRRT